MKSPLGEFGCELVPTRSCLKPQLSRQVSARPPPRTYDPTSPCQCRGRTWLIASIWAVAVIVIDGIPCNLFGTIKTCPGVLARRRVLCVVYRPIRMSWYGDVLRHIPSGCTPLSLRLACWATGFDSLAATTADAASANQSELGTMLSASLVLLSVLEAACWPLETLA